MKKVFAVLALFCAAPGWAEGVWHRPEQLRASADSPALLYFTDHASVLCRELEEDLRTDVRLLDTLKKFYATQIDANAKSNAPLVNKFEVPWVPTLIVWDGQKQLRRLERESDREQVLAFLQGKVLAQAGGSASAAGAPSGSNGVDLTCATDPVGDNASGNLDITQLCAGLVGNNLQIQITCAGAPELKTAANYNIFVDADGSEDTGAQTGGGSGADRLIQGAFIYKFSGSTPAEWKWDKIGAANLEVRGKTLIVSVPQTPLGVSGSPRVWVGSQTADFKPADWAPQTGPLAVGGSGGVATSDATAESNTLSASGAQAQSSPASAASPAPELKGEAKATLEDPKGDAPALFDIQTVNAAMGGDKLLIQFVLGGKAPLNSLHIFINADKQDSTGYTDGAHPGAEFMIEGTTFYKHKADAGTGWGWDASGALTPPPVQQGNTVTYTIPCSRIGLTKDSPITVWFATTDATWNTADTAPDSGGWTYPTK